MHVKKNTIYFFYIWIVWVTGCSSVVSSTPAVGQGPYPVVDLLPTGYPSNDVLFPNNSLQIDPAYLPTPQANLSSLAGTIQTPIEHKRIAQTIFYLARAIGDDGRVPPPVLSDPSASHGDLVGETDREGDFVLLNIPPGNYYMFVWAPYDWRPIQMSEQDQSPRLLEIVSNQVYPLGNVYVTWP